MKKLLDETPDDLTRALLEAGRSHRPPAANQAHVLAALGVGASVGLFSSKASAWLATGAGKLTVLGVGLGIAAAVYTALPEPGAGTQGEARVAQVALAARVSERPLQPAPVPEAPLPEPSRSQSVPALVANAPSSPRTDSVSRSIVANDTARRANAPAASESPRRASKQRKSTAVRRDVVAEPLERLAEGPQPHPGAAAYAPPAVGAPAPASPPEGVAAAAVVAARAPGLESEIQLVDAMRGAAQRNDAPELRRLVDSYRGTFPDGQLRQEVSELALRALPKPVR